MRLSQNQQAPIAGRPFLTLKRVEEARHGRADDRVIVRPRRGRNALVPSGRSRSPTSGSDETDRLSPAWKHRRIVILPLIAEEGVQLDLLDLALGISIADPWTFEDRLDTVAGAILGSAARKDRDFDLL